MLFGIYPEYKGHPLNRVEHILYDSSSKVIWAISLSYLIFSCTMNTRGKSIFFMKFKNIKKKKFILYIARACQ